MKVKLPADFQSAISETTQLTALLDKNGWRAAAFIAVCVGKGSSPTRFAKDLNAKGWSPRIVTRHYEAWEAAASKGKVPHAADLQFGQRIELPTDGWTTFYLLSIESDSRYNVDDKSKIIEQAKADGTGPSKAIDIAKNPKAMAAAIIASPKVQQAAAKALVDAQAVQLLAASTASAAQNRRTERNRAAAGRGDPKPRRATDKVPTGLSPGTEAFISVQGLAQALRALVTTFPTEWADLSDEARADEDFREVCLETLERISTATDYCKALVEGIDANELAELLQGGAE